MKNYGLLFITVLTLIVVGMFFWTYYPQTCEYCYVYDEGEEEILKIVFPSDDVLPVTRVFENGMHIVTGSLLLPDACYDIIGLTVVEQELPEEVTIDLRTVRTQENCAQVVTSKVFEVDFQASELVLLNMRINGRFVSIEYLEEYDTEES
jgi:hypothetical protein